MTLPVVVNRHAHDFALGGAYIGRGGPYGNPFRIGLDGDRDKVCERFEREILPTLDVEPLRGEAYLICHCAPVRCHNDAIIRKLRATSPPPA